MAQQLMPIHPAHIVGEFRRCPIALVSYGVSALALLLLLALVILLFDGLFDVLAIIGALLIGVWITWEWAEWSADIFQVVEGGWFIHAHHFPGFNPVVQDRIPLRPATLTIRRSRLDSLLGCGDLEILVAGRSYTYTGINHFPHLLELLEQVTSPTTTIP